MVALLIGVSEYKHGLNPLPSAVKDVEAMQRILVNPEMGGFAEADIKVLRNPQPDDIAYAIYEHCQHLCLGHEQLVTQEISR